MDYNYLKTRANNYLSERTAECSYIEYKKSASQFDRILKTICAYGNNYMDNDYAFIYVGVEEENTETNKAIPVLPIIGIEEGAIEKSIN